jgi:hypothetical protein
MLAEDSSSSSLIPAKALVMALMVSLSRGGLGVGRLAAGEPVFPFADAALTAGSTASDFNACCLPAVVVFFTAVFFAAGFLVSFLVAIFFLSLYTKMFDHWP